MEKRYNVYEDDRWYVPYGGKTAKIRCDNTKHYPNKNEARLLRRIMSETGLNEEEVRSDRHYCIMLSEAQKQGQKANHTCHTKKFYCDLIKKACKDTGLVPQHPDTLVVLQCLIDEKYDKSYGYWRWNLWMHRNNPLTAEQAVKQYAK